jgi:hypothetical protein
VTRLDALLRRAQLDMGRRVNTVVMAHFATRKVAAIVGLAFVVSALPIAFVMTSAAVASRSSHRQLPCGQRRPRILAGSQAVVYALTTARGRKEYRGCTYRGSRSFVIGESGECIPDPCGGVSNLTLSGSLVAYEEVSGIGLGATRYEEEPTSLVWRVNVLDLRTGKTVRTAPTGAPLEPRPGYLGVGETTKIVLGSDLVAWIAFDIERSRASGREVPFYDVYALDASGSHLLAAGTEVDPSSLALAGRRVYWSEGGKPAAAVIG